VFLGAAVMLLALLALSEASIGIARCEDHSCMVDASGQQPALVQVRMLKDTRSVGSSIRDGIVQEKSLNAEFDCTAGVQNWRIGWSNAKKFWCCTHEQVGCDYNCKDGLEAEWPALKKTWCCKNKDVGCEFNCTEGEAANWNESKATWCCVNELVGCGFNCSAGHSRWQKGWSTLKKEYCCKNELLGCMFNCSEDLSNRTLAWPSIKKAWCCKTEGAGCEEKRPCLTQESKLAVGSMLRGRVAPPGTRCMFGLDERDEGYHCILEGGFYGSLGWCYTAKDRSSWGACNEDCPLFGPLKKIGDRLRKDLITPVRKFGDRLEHLEKLEKQLEGPLMSGSGPAAKGGTTGSDDSKARSDVGNVSGEAKKGDDKKGGKKDGQKDAKQNTKVDAKKDAKKGANKGNDKNGGKKDEKKDAAKKAAKKDGKKA